MSFHLDSIGGFVSGGHSLVRNPASIPSNQTSSTTITPSYGWAMNKFPSHYSHQQNQEQRGGGGGGGGNVKREEADSTQFHDQSPSLQHPRPERLEEEEEEDEDRARCEWDLDLSSVISSADTSSVSDTLGVIEFDPSATLVATGGIARKIRIYRFATLLPHPALESNPSDQRVMFLEHSRTYDFYICTPAKLSSLRWLPESSGQVIGSGDYDGVVTEYDLERRVPISERDDHGGHRVWSMDYSPARLGASGSDDGTVQLWDTRRNGGKCLAVVQPGVGRPHPVCCVEFDPFGGSIMAVGCADRRAYGYDVRKLLAPVHVFEGHTKTVTYVKFVDAQTMVTASIDGCLKMWDLGTAHALRSYRGHVNTRSFVGLSVWRHGGLIGCGSEDDRVFVYDKRWGEPIWIRGFESRNGFGQEGGGFVSSVCWRQVGEDHCTMIAGGSDGVLQVFVGKRSSSSYA